MLNLATVLGRLPDHRKSRSGDWLARCPAHRDTDPSLSVKAGRHGYVLLHCFAGCGRAAILAALGLEPDARPLAYVRPAVDIWEEARRGAYELAKRHGWLEGTAVGLRYWRQRIDELHSQAERLGPDDPAAWEMLETAEKLEHEFRLMDEAAQP